MKKRMARFKLYRILGLQPRVKADMLGVNTIKFFLSENLHEDGVCFQGREMLLFLTINMAAVTWKRLWKKDFASFETFSLLHQVTQLLEGREKNNNNNNNNNKIVCYTPEIR